MGQVSNEKKINQLVDSICNCSRKAQDVVEFELCKSIAQPVDSFSDADRFYFLKRLIEQCEQDFEKIMRPELDSLTIQPCLFLQEPDLREFDLIKSMKDPSSIFWSARTQGQIMSDFTDERIKFKSDSLAQQYIEKQKKLSLSEVGVKANTFSHETFQAVNVFMFENAGYFNVYHVYARKGKLVCFLVVILLKDDLTIIKSLLDKVSLKVQRCK